MSYLVEQLPHCDLLRLSLLTGDLSCQLDKSSKSYCQISSTFHHNLKVVILLSETLHLSPCRTIGTDFPLSPCQTIGTNFPLFSSTFYHYLKVAILLAENVTSFTRASDCRIPPLFITIWKLLFCCLKTLHLSPLAYNTAGIRRFLLFAFSWCCCGFSSWFLGCLARRFRLLFHCSRQMFKKNP